MSPSTTGIVPGFLSTPSGWRATIFDKPNSLFAVISIHALRVEGDLFCFVRSLVRVISIHALRVEGDGAL